MKIAFLRWSKLARSMIAATVTALAVVMMLGSASSAQAAAPLTTGFADGLLTDFDPAVRDFWLDRANDANAGLVRISIDWSSLAAQQPAAASDPADPAYIFDHLDAAVRSADAKGLQVFFTITGAPRWAEGAHRPSPKKAPAGTWKPKPAALGDFAHALAERYSGTYREPGSSGSALPRVRYFQVWNEPNVSTYLTPQWNGKKQVAAGIYRRMGNAFYDGVKSAVSSDQVITGGTAPYGDPPGGQRTRPLLFWRNVMCIDREGGSTQGCKGPGRARFDILAHHPITPSGGPHRSAISPDDITIPDLGNLRKTLRTAERRNTVGGPRRHQLWVTELWWSTNPPDKRGGVPVAKHARWIDEALYLLWRQGARVVINLQIRDADFQSGTSSVATGIFFYSGEPKPAYRAFSFPLVAKRTGGKSVHIWGKAPGAGPVRIEAKRGSAWERIGSASAPGYGVFTETLSLRGAAQVRAVSGGEVSYTYPVGAHK